MLSLYLTSHCGENKLQHLHYGSSSRASVKRHPHKDTTIFFSFFFFFISIIQYGDFERDVRVQHPYLELQQEPIACCDTSHMIHVNSCSLKKVLLLEGVGEEDVVNDEPFYSHTCFALTNVAGYANEINHYTCVYIILQLRFLGTIISQHSNSSESELDVNKFLIITKTG